MSEPPVTSPESPIANDADEISLLDLLIVLAKHKSLIFRTTAGAAIAAAIVSFILPVYYTGTTKILPPQQNQSTAAAMLGQIAGQLGGLPGAAGGALGLKNPNDLYVGMLKSRTVADNLIDRFELKKIYDEDTYYYARKTLEQRTIVSSGKDAIITIEVEDRDRKRAAALANGYVDELYKLTQTLAVTEASQRRLFFEKQLKGAREQLTRAEAALQQSIESKGIAGVEVQGRSLVETGAQLRAQITAREVQVDAMRIFATDNHPDTRRLRQEIASLKSELARLEGGDPTNGNNQGATPAGMENLRRLRDVKYFEALVDLLTKQYEAAKIDEARDTPLIQVMDKAVEPEKKSKPKRILIVALTGILAFILSIFWAFFKEAVTRAGSSPDQAERFKTLHTYLFGR